MLGVPSDSYHNSRLYSSSVSESRNPSSSMYQKRSTLMPPETFSKANYFSPTYYQHKNNEDMSFKVTVSSIDKPEDRVNKLKLDETVHRQGMQDPSYQCKSANKYRPSTDRQANYEAKNRPFMQTDKITNLKQVSQSTNENADNYTKLLQRLNKKEKIIKELQKLCQTKISDNIRSLPHEKDQDEINSPCLIRSQGISKNLAQGSGNGMRNTLDVPGAFKVDLIRSSVGDRGNQNYCSDKIRDQLKFMERKKSQLVAPKRNPEELNAFESLRLPRKSYKAPEQINAFESLRVVKRGAAVPEVQINAFQSFLAKNRKSFYEEDNKFLENTKLSKGDSNSPEHPKRQSEGSQKRSMQIKKNISFNETLNSSQTLNSNSSLHSQPKYSDLSTQSYLSQSDSPIKEPSFNGRKSYDYESIINQKIGLDLKQVKEIKTITTSSEYFAGKKTSVHDFQLKKSLGEGKFGLVYQAFHKQTNSLYALKKISKKVIKSNLMVDQLLQEIKIQSFCNHQNILKVYGFFDDSESIYLILQYMEEGTLFSRLKSKKILSEDQAALVLKDIVAGIIYLHQNGIAHRDIKPENVVMSHGVGKLCDFGWATICTDRRKTYCGTFDYVAPQILEGSEYDATVDLWCLGVLAYELLVGKAPFYHISRKQTMKKIMSVDKIQYPPNLSKDAISFIQKLIQKDPEARMSGSDILKHPFLSKVQQS